MGEIKGGGDIPRVRVNTPSLIKSANAAKEALGLQMPEKQTISLSPASEDPAKERGDRVELVNPIGPTQAESNKVRDPELPYEEQVAQKVAELGGRPAQVYRSGEEQLSEEISSGVNELRAVKGMMEDGGGGDDESWMDEMGWDDQDSSSQEQIDEESKRVFERNLLDELNRIGRGRNHSAEDVVAAAERATNPENWNKYLDENNLRDLPVNQLAGLLGAGLILSGIIRRDGELLVALGDETREATYKLLKDSDEVFEGKKGSELVEELERVVREKQLKDSEEPGSNSPQTADSASSVSSGKTTLHRHDSHLSESPADSEQPNSIPAVSVEEVTGEKTADTLMQESRAKGDKDGDGESREGDNLQKDDDQEMKLAEDQQIIKGLLDEMGYKGQPLTAQQIFDNLTPEIRAELGGDSSPANIARLYSGEMLLGGYPLSGKLLNAVAPEVRERIIEQIKNGDPDDPELKGNPERAQEARRNLEEYRKSKGLAQEEVEIQADSGLTPEPADASAVSASASPSVAAPSTASMPDASHQTPDNHDTAGHVAHGQAEGHGSDHGRQEPSYLSNPNWFVKSKVGNIVHRIIDKPRMPDRVISAEEKAERDRRNVLSTQAEKIIKEKVTNADSDGMVAWLHDNKISPTDFAKVIAPLFKSERFGSAVIKGLKKEVEGGSLFHDAETKAWLDSYRRSREVQNIFRPFSFSRLKNLLNRNKEEQDESNPQPLSPENQAVKDELVKIVGDNLANIPLGEFNRVHAASVIRSGQDLAAMGLDPSDTEKLQKTIDDSLSSIQDDAPRAIIGNLMFDRLNEATSANDEAEVRSLIKTARLLKLDKNIARLGRFVEDLSKILEENK